MDISLTEAELQTLSAMRDQARNHEIGYWQIDQWLFQALGGRGRWPPGRLRAAPSRLRTRSR